MVINGTVSVGQFVAFNSYIGMLVWPMIACGDCINTFSQASAGYKRIKDIFDEKPDIIDKVVEKDGEHLTGEESDLPVSRWRYTCFKECECSH